MIKLLEEIDEMLAAMECVAHGMEGRAITEMRGRIQTELSKSHKPVVMQAEGSDGVQGAAVGNSAAGKGVSVEMCSCGAIGVTTRHGIDQCEECGKPV